MSEDVYKRQAVRIAIPAGIGLFIAFLGLQNAKIVIPSTSTGVTLGSFNLLTEGNWAVIMPMLVTVAAVLAIAIMSKKNVRGAVLWGILGGAVLYYLLGLTVPGFYAEKDVYKRQRRRRRREGCPAPLGQPKAG